VHRYGGKEIADVAVPAELLALSPAQMEAAAAGEDLSGWTDEARESAEQALVRVDAAIRRAGSELAYYLRHRPADAATPPWLDDDTQELARYHLYDRAGREESTVRLRYQDVIKRLQGLLAEDIRLGRGEGDDDGTGSSNDVQVQSGPRLFSRDTLGRL